MKKLSKMWTEGFEFLFTENIISFYTFFTVILAECMCLWASYEAAAAIPHSIILIGYIINVIVFAWLKGNWEGTRKEVLFAILYVVMFIALFTIGIIINAKINIIVTGIPLIITAGWIGIREFQSCEGFQTMFMSIMSQVIVVGGPIISFTACLSNITTLPIALKFIIPFLYLISIPLIVYYEDYTASCNIFELAFDITWTRESKDS